MHATPTRTHRAITTATRHAHRARTRLAEHRRRTLTAIAQRGTLSIVGLGFFASAGYAVDLVAGLITTGVALLLIDWRLVS